MRILANLFIVLFSLFALSNIIQVFSSSLASIPLVISSIDQIQILTVVVALLIYLGSAFNRHLPKLLFYPLLLWVLWATFDYWPMHDFIGQAYHLCIGIAQLLTILFLVRKNQRDNESSYFLVPSQFTGPSFSGWTLIIFMVINIIIAPVALVVIGYNTAAHLIDSSSAGFVQLKPDGLYMQEKTYQRDSKTIKLIAMIHLAQSQYYQKVSKTIPKDKTLILMEGVSDNDNLLKNNFNYGNLANFLGLTSQGHFDIDTRVISSDQLSADQSTTPESQTGVDMLPADIDISAFDPQTIEVLDALAKYVLNTDSPASGYFAFNQWIQEHADPDIDKIIMKDLLDKRNAAVLSYIPKALQQYNTLVLPWGALHMKGLEQAIKEDGFTQVQSQRFISIDFRQLPYDKILQKLAPE